MGFFTKNSQQDDLELGKRARKHLEWEEKNRRDAIKKRNAVARQKEIDAQKAAKDRAAAEKLARDRRTVEERNRQLRAGKERNADANKGWWRS